MKGSSFAQGSGEGHPGGDPYNGIVGKSGRAGSISKDLAGLLERLHLPTAPAEYSLLPRGSSPSLEEDAGSTVEGELFPLVGERGRMVPLFRGGGAVQTAAVSSNE